MAFEREYDSLHSFSNSNIVREMGCRRGRTRLIIWILAVFLGCSESVGSGRDSRVAGFFSSLLPRKIWLPIRMTLPSSLNPQKTSCGGSRTRLMLEILASVGPDLLHSLFAGLFSVGRIWNSRRRFNFVSPTSKGHGALRGPYTFTNPEKWARNEAGFEW